MKKYVLSLLLLIPYLEAARQYNVGSKMRDNREEKKTYLERLCICDDKIETFEAKLQTLSPSDLQYAEVKVDLARAQQDKQHVKIMHAIWKKDHAFIQFYKS